MNNRGYSLIELMVAISIVGVLAAVAIPNWTTYRNKSRQAEARANLEALYAAEKTFFFDRVFYNPRIDGIGFRPEGTLSYKIGFAVDSGNPPGTADCINSSSAACGASVIPGYTVTWQEHLTYAQPTVLGGTVVGPGGFTAQARSNLTGNGDDVWTIDELKTLTNTNPNIY